MGGQFNNKNPGKRGISLNVRHPKGTGDREAPRRDVGHRRGRLLARRARQLGPRLRGRCKKIKPDIIYVQQSGMGAQGTYGRFRTVGPIANAFAGLSEMSGLPEPAMPAGWGYSYLDWMGALQLRARDAERALPPRAHRRRPVDRRVADRGRALHQRHGACSTGRRTIASGRATATARRTSPPRRMASIRAPATIAGSRSRASRNAEWNALMQSRRASGVGARIRAS